MKVDVAKLKTSLLSDIDDLEHDPGALCTEYVIGKILGMQIQVKVAKVSSEFMDDEEKLHCIFEGHGPL